MGNNICIHELRFISPALPSIETTAMRLEVRCFSGKHPVRASLAQRNLRCPSTYPPPTPPLLVSFTNWHPHHPVQRVLELRIFSEDAALTQATSAAISSRIIGVKKPRTRSSAATPFSSNKSATTRSVASCWSQTFPSSFTSTCMMMPYSLVPPCQPFLSRR